MYAGTSAIAIASTCAHSGIADKSDHHVHKDTAGNTAKPGTMHSVMRILVTAHATRARSRQRPDDLCFPLEDSVGTDIGTGVGTDVGTDVGAACSTGETPADRTGCGAPCGTIASPAV